MYYTYYNYKYLQYLVGVFHDCTHQVSLEVNTTFHAMPDQPHPIHFSANSRSSTYCWLREENTEVIHKAKAQSRDMYARTKYLIPHSQSDPFHEIVPGTRPFRSVPFREIVRPNPENLPWERSSCDTCHKKNGPPLIGPPSP